ncbi:MAG: hypothetical protein IPK63_19010 [Candidatus Competibacteraceae bacterium]|nr:hypothetical protein [Candidatus Competibacteraceae bacterium]
MLLDLSVCKRSTKNPANRRSIYPRVHAIQAGRSRVCSASTQKEVVYDITVTGTHCFFANGILVHNCHHAAARQYQTLLKELSRRLCAGIDPYAGTTGRQGSGRYFPRSAGSRYGSGPD